MWQVKGIQTATDWLDFEPIHVLYEFDGPRIFTCRDRKGRLFLAYLSNEHETGFRFLVVPFSTELEYALTTGQMDLRDTLWLPRVWIFDLQTDWIPVRAWEASAAALPADLLPRPGVMLWSHLRQIVRPVRAARLASSATSIRAALLPRVAVSRRQHSAFRWTMARPAYILCCQSTSDDRETGAVSCFGVIDKLQISLIQPPEAGQPWPIVLWPGIRIVAAWMLEPGESEDESTNTTTNF